jgi:ribosomal protein S11
VLLSDNNLVEKQKKKIFKALLSGLIEVSKSFNKTMLEFTGLPARINTCIAG